jgi:hypothetical protein
VSHSSGCVPSKWSAIAVALILVDKPLLHQFFELKRVPNRVHDGMLEHGIDAVTRPPS